MQNRYEIAVHCLAVRQGDGSETYGKNAVGKLAKRLGWSKSEVYDYANVAVAWPDETGFDELSSKTDKFRKPLTWTHFRRIAAEKDATKREQLIQNCLQHGWSVRELKKEMQTGNGFTAPNAMPDEAVTESKPRQGLAAAIQDYGSQVAAFKRRAGTFGQHLAAKINEVDPSDCNDASLDQLRAVRRDLKELIDQLDTSIGQFAERRKSVGPIANKAQTSDGTIGQTLVELHGFHGTTIESFGLAHA